jgi:hypothetical protein
MTLRSTEDWNLARVTRDRQRAVEAFGLTERQARFLVEVMVHSGVFVPRQYCTFAGIAHGQKVHDFLRRPVERGYARPIQVGAMHRGRMFHIRRKPLYAAIGEADNRHRKAAPLGRMVERLMALDTVLAGRSWTWLGAEKDKVAYFRRECRGRLEDRELPHLTFGAGASQVVRYFPDKLPIGMRVDGPEHVFVYLMTSAVPLDFRLFLHRHAELLRALTRWTIRVLVPQPFAKAVKTFQAVVRQEFTAVTPADADELLWLFRERQRLGGTAAGPKDERFRSAARQFRQPRFGVLYRLWQRHGDAVVWAAQSPVLRDALARGEGSVEFVHLPHQYLHLSSLVGVA